MEEGSVVAGLSIPARARILSRVGRNTEQQRAVSSPQTKLKEKSRPTVWALCEGRPHWPFRLQPRKPSNTPLMRRRRDAGDTRVLSARNKQLATFRRSGDLVQPDCQSVSCSLQSHCDQSSVSFRTRRSSSRSRQQQTDMTVFCCLKTAFHCCEQQPPTTGRNVQLSSFAIPLLTNGQACTRDRVCGSCGRLAPKPALPPGPHPPCSMRMCCVEMARERSNANYSTHVVGVRV